MLYIVDVVKERPDKVVSVRTTKDDHNMLLIRLHDDKIYLNWHDNQFSYKETGRIAHYIQRFMQHDERPLRQAFIVRIPELEPLAVWLIDDNITPPATVPPPAMSKPPNLQHLKHLRKLLAAKMENLQESNYQLSEERHEAEEQLAHQFDHRPDESIFL